jgi:hypothetical protein
MHNNANIVPKGRAAEEPEAMSRKLREINDQSMTPGTNAAV